MMTRIHVAAMFRQSGYHTARRVLHARKARQEFFVYLEQLRTAARREDARRIAAQEDIPRVTSRAHFSL